LKTGGRAASAALATLLGLSLAWVLLDRSGGVAEALPEIARRISAADPGLLLAALGLFVASQVLRAFRWMILSFRDRMPFSVSMPVTSVHIGLGHLLPARLADVVFVALFRHVGAVPVGRGTATILHAKLLDIAAMGVVTGFSIAAGMGRSALVAPILVLGGSMGIFLLSPLLGGLRRLLAPILRRTRLRGCPSWFDDLVESSSVHGRLGRLSGAFAVSLVAWIAKLTMFCFLISALGVRGIPFWKIFFASCITDLMMALPINGLLSIGTVEAGWAAGFAMVGVEGIVPPGIGVVELGFSVHLLWISMAVLLMLPALPLMGMAVRSGRRAAPSDGDPDGA